MCPARRRIGGTAYILEMKGETREFPPFAPPAASPARPTATRNLSPTDKYPHPNPPAGCSRHLPSLQPVESHQKTDTFSAPPAHAPSHSGTAFRRCARLGAAWIQSSKTQSAPLPRRWFANNGGTFPAQKSCPNGARR